ncbi:MAG: hypothetical protein K0V04_11750 [Deltaproteobacteria bacterium]|nr:hypothetical protein [Deltaproteobacteria bacterium]
MRTTHLPIATPCHEDWDAMDPDARGRFCQVCVKPVHDLSAMSEPQAQQLLSKAAGTRICVRYRHDSEGEIRFRQPAAAPTCPAPRRMAWVGTAAVAMTLAACTPHEHPDARAQHIETVGSISPSIHMTVSIPSHATADDERFTQGRPTPVEEPPPADTVEVLGDWDAPQVVETKGDVAIDPVPPPLPDAGEVGVLGNIAAPAPAPEGEAVFGWAIAPAPQEPKPCDGAQETADRESRKAGSSK